MKELIKVDFTVIRKRMASWVVLAILILFLVIGYVATYFALDQFSIGLEILLPTHVFEYSLQNLNSNGVLSALIMGGLFFGTPFSWGTYSTRLIQGKSRTKIFLGKAVVALLILLSWLGIGLIVGHVASFSFGFAEGDLAYRTPGFWPVLRGSLLTLLVWGAWFMVAGALSLWTRSTAMGIGGGLAYYFLENIFVFAIPGFNTLVEGYRYLFLGQSTSAISSQLFAIQVTGEETGLAIHLPTASGVLACYLAALLALSWWRFVSMEFPE